MTPAPWQFAILALAAYRLTRLIAWDTLPPLVRLRERVVGTTVADGEVQFRENGMLDLLQCPFCLGAWVSLATYLAWRWLPGPTLAAASVAAMSAVVGLVAKNLDD